MSRNTKTKKCLYILVEGKTELAYIQDFSKRNESVKVVVVTESSSRPKLLKDAIKFSDENQLDTWIIFDQDDKHNEAKEIYTNVEAFNKKGKATIHIAYLAPCFEIWALLHFKSHNIPRSRKEIQKELGQYIKYDHGKHPIVDVCKLETGYENAVHIAKQWDVSLLDTPEYNARLFASIYKLTEHIKGM